MKRKFPRSKVKTIIKKTQPNVRLGKNADLLIFLDYMMFIKRLATEANIAAQEQKENTLTAAHVNSVLKDVLKGMRG
ncbi:centromere protein W-like [Patiria miniata]|uniref:Transcription factor CBF/NF-Y/archaeal histone domain-containing protein n=1 Tax=Patiria miniata TaxID=46514 RepID=A0A914A098_PATMI|nr:centromere protein W-like [Patiria miniata]